VLADIAQEYGRVIVRLVQAVTIMVVVEAIAMVVAVGGYWDGGGNDCEVVKVQR